MHVQWVNMLKVENCTYALVTNLLYATLLYGSPRPVLIMISYHWSNTVGDPLSLPCQHALGDEFS